MTEAVSLLTKGKIKKDLPLTVSLTFGVKMLVSVEWNNLHCDCISS